MRRRHRCATQICEILAWRCVRRVRRESRNDVNARRGNVRFQYAGDGRRSARRERCHQVAGIGRRQQKTLFQHKRDFVAGVNFGKNEIRVGLSDHQGRNVDETRFPMHDNGVARNVVNHGGNGTGILCVFHHVCKQTAGALQQHNVPGCIGVVDQWLTAVRRHAWRSVRQSGVVVIGKHQYRLDGIAVLQWRREQGFFRRVFARN